MYNQMQPQGDSFQPVKLDYHPLTEYNEEIRKSSIILNKLILLLKEGSITSETFMGIAVKYINKIENGFKIRNVYDSVFYDESQLVNIEYTNAVETKEILQTRNVINDITEEEYSIKYEVANWELNHQLSRKKRLDEAIGQLKNIRNSLNSEEIPEIILLSNNESTMHMDILDEVFHLRLVKIAKCIMENIISPE